jgi:hypothetical protein
MRFITCVFTIAVLLFSGMSISRSPETKGNAGDDAAAKSGDDPMTCEQIGTELAPYVQQIRPTVSALNDTNQELKRRGEKRLAEEAPIAAAMSAASIGAGRDPTGMAQRSVNKAIEAHQQEVWQRAMTEDKPLAERQLAQGNALADQAQRLQSNARIQRLLQLAQDKHCH